MPEPSGPDQRRSDLDAALAMWRFDNVRRIAERVVEGNLHQIDRALSRMNRRSYGVEDFADDLRTAWSRGARNTVDWLRVLYGLPPSPDNIPFVTATVDEGSQTSGAIVFSAQSAHNLTLEIKHLHGLSGGEFHGRHLGKANFQFEPKQLTAGAPPTQVVVKLTGLNQYDAREELVEKTALPPGQYIGFAGGTVQGEFEIVCVVLLSVVAPQSSDPKMS